MALVSRRKGPPIHPDERRGLEYLGATAGRRTAEAANKIHFRRDLQFQLDSRWQNAAADARRNHERCGPSEQSSLICTVWSAQKQGIGKELAESENGTHV